MRFASLTLVRPLPFALDGGASPRLISRPETMSGTMIGVISAACIFSGTVLGLALSKRVPGHHLSADSKDAIKVGAGMISMMAALVLGLLVSSAKSTFDSTNTAITEGGARVILIDRLLANYGPEAKAAREQLRRGVTAAVEMLWPEESPTNLNLSDFERAAPMERLRDKIRELRPQTDAQQALQTQMLALINELLLNRWVQIEQAQVSLPLPFLIILLFWLTLLYTCFGLIAPRNATVITTMFLGALALATAIFLIVEMSHPMGGALKVSSGPMRKALEHLGR